MLAAIAKSAKIGQNEFRRFPLKDIFSGFSALSAFSGLVPNYGKKKYLTYIGIILIISLLLGNLLPYLNASYGTN